jgi:ketosteroid isomerase-like protein
MHIFACKDLPEWPEKKGRKQTKGNNASLTIKQKQMKKGIKITLLIIVIMVAGSGFRSLQAQEWSPAQKEVWKNVNDYWTLMAKGDVKGFMEYFHPDYIGWDYDSPNPMTKTETSKWLEFFTQGQKFPFWDIKPLAIKVYGDVAFVHYYYSRVAESTDGKKSTENGRWTDILLKQNGRWVLIGDHGGNEKSK